jgi:hypothetical protein
MSTASPPTISSMRLSQAARMAATGTPKLA